MISKKASLNLSIQAIVILVMAMAVLGLGLGFIRTLIGQGQDQFEGAIKNAELENPASDDKPVTVDNEVEVPTGDYGDLKVGFFNKDTLETNAEGGFIPNVTGCSGYSIKTGAQEVKIGESIGYQVLINTSNAVGTRDVCTLEIQALDNNGAPLGAVASTQFKTRVSS